MKQLTRRLSLLLFSIAYITILVSCSNAIQETNFPVSETATIRLGVSGDARSILPALSINDVTALTFKGSIAGGTEQTLGTWNSYAAMTNASIDIDPGTWTFTLTATSNGLDLSGTIANKTIANGDNDLSFTLAITEYNITIGFGSIEVDVTYPATQNVYVTALLETYPEGTIVSGYEQTTLSPVTEGDTKKVTYIEPIVPSGTYRLVFKFYADSNQTILLNTYREIITVVKGLISKASRSIEDLNDYYTIEYKFDEDFFLSHSDFPTFYVGKKGIKLPIDGISSSLHFEGWYDNETFNGPSVTEILAGSAGNKTFYGKLKNKYVCTSYNVYDVISTLSKAEEYLIIVIGEISEKTISDISDALKGNTMAGVHLDLSQTTELASIGKNVFCECTNLISITIPSSVTYIEADAFTNCYALKSVTFADTSTWSVTLSDTYEDGEEMCVTDPETNAMNLAFDYFNHFWYKK